MLTKGFASGLRALRMGLVLCAAMVVVSCGGGGGGGTPAVPNADPTGYYSDTGTTTIFDITGTQQSINDLQGMIYQNRIMLFSKAKGYAYDGTIQVSGNSITGSLKEYFIPGDTPIDATMTATFDPADHSISGTINVSASTVYATSAFSAPFLLHFSAGRPASTVADIVNDGTHPSWSGYLYDTTTDPMTFILADNGSTTTPAATMTTTTIFSLNVTDFDSCNFAGDFTPVAGSLYQVNMTTTGIGCLVNEAPVTGLAALNGTNLVVMAVFPGGVKSPTQIGFFGEFQ